MRLLTSVAARCNGFNTHSPSEPLLVVGSIKLMYHESERLGEVLNIFSQSLCAAGLVEKGMWGERCARTLLLIARDFAAPPYSTLNPRNYLKPVPLMNFLINFSEETYSTLPIKWSSTKPLARHM